MGQRMFTSFCLLHELSAFCRRFKHENHYPTIQKDQICLLHDLNTICGINTGTKVSSSPHWFSNRMKRFKANDDVEKEGLFFFDDFSI